MVNRQDSNGNTPLHIAIKNANLECCYYLINQKADLTIKNKLSEAALHHCVISRRPDALELILNHAKNVDINIGGRSNGTPLHYSAAIDEIECAKILVKRGADLCKACDIGFRPVHLAISSCTNKVLKFLLNEGTKKGCSKLNQVSFIDVDRNKPLHAAVQVGNFEAVKLCLDSGAKINEISESDHFHVFGLKAGC